MLGSPITWKWSENLLRSFGDGAQADVVILEAVALTKRFGAVVAVDRVSLGVGAGEIVGLLGPNGAGKSTTLHMLLGVLTPDSGTIRIFGLDYAGHRSEILSRINFAASYLGLPGVLQVREVLASFARLYGLRSPGARVGELVEMLELGPILRRQVRALSSGQLTRVQLAKALLNEPELLILDEPTANLDPDVADRMRSLLLQVRRETGKAMLITSHNMREVERMADRIQFMSAGRIISTGTAAELTDRYGVTDLEEVFLKVARQ